MEIFFIIICVLKVIPVKILMIETDAKNLKFIGQYKIPRTPKTVLKETRVRRLKLPDFKAHYKATATKRMQYWHKNKHMEQYSQDRLVFM